MSVRGLALVGLGMALPPHAQALSHLTDRYRVVGAWSRSQERREAAAAAYGLPVTPDLEALIADPQVEVGLILTPPDAHSQIADRFLRAGKHVVVEKPLDSDLMRAEALVAAATSAGRKLGVVLQHRFRPASQTLIQHLTRGDLGEIAAATCTVPWWRDQRYYDAPGRGTLARDGGGVLMTQAIHTLDLFRTLTGGVRRLACLAATTDLHRMECEDVAAAVFELKSGGVGTLFATTAAYPGQTEQIRLICTKGTATLDGDALIVDWHDGRRTQVGEASGMGAGADPMAFSHAAHQALLADFALALDESREPLVNGREALATQRLIATLLKSSLEERWLCVKGDGG